MGRKPTGVSARERARELLEIATTADQIRTAQAVLLPLDLGLSLEATAQIVGKTPSWVSRTRRRFIAADGADTAVAAGGRGGRRHSLLTLEEEIDLVKRAVVLGNRFVDGGVHRRLRILLEERGLTPSPSTVTAIMQRTAHQLFPGQKASYLQENVGPLCQLWAREVYQKMREEQGSN